MSEEQASHLCVYNPADDSLIREDVVKWVVDRKNTLKDEERHVPCQQLLPFDKSLTKPS